MKHAFHRATRFPSHKEIGSHAILEPTIEDQRGPTHQGEATLAEIEEDLRRHGPRSRRDVARRARDPGSHSRSIHAKSLLARPGDGAPIIRIREPGPGDAPDKAARVLGRGHLLKPTATLRQAAERQMRYSRSPKRDTASRKGKGKNRIIRRKTRKIAKDKQIRGRERVTGQEKQDRQGYPTETQGEMETGSTSSESSPSTARTEPCRSVTTASTMASCSSTARKSEDNRYINHQCIKKTWIK